MEFSRQEYWSGLPFPSPGDLPNPGIKPFISSLAGSCLSLMESCQGSPPPLLPNLNRHVVTSATFRSLVQSQSPAQI